jgi:hypothetical protein
VPGRDGERNAGGCFFDLAGLNGLAVELAFCKSFWERST